MNSTADQAFTKLVPYNSAFMTHIRCVNASTSLTLAVGGIYRAASKTSPIVAATQVYSGLTGGTLGIDLLLAALGLSLDSSAALYLSLTTGQGGAATADLHVLGVVVS